MGGIPVNPPPQTLEQRFLLYTRLAEKLSRDDALVERIGLDGMPEYARVEQLAPRLGSILAMYWTFCVIVQRHPSLSPDAQLTELLRSQFHLPAPTPIDDPDALARDTIAALARTEGWSSLGMRAKFRIVSAQAFAVENRQMFPELSDSVHASLEDSAIDIAQTLFDAAMEEVGWSLK